jgi:RND family efflux transporter MFP subunit
MQRTHALLFAAGTSCGLLGLLVLTGCNGPGAVAASASVKANPASAAEEGSVSVTVVHPVRKTLTRTTTQPGRIEAFEQTPIFAMIEGYIRKTRTALDKSGAPLLDKSGKPVVRELADMGDRVEENEVLAEIDVPQREEELKQKVAQVAQAKAAIEHAKAGITRAEGEYQRWNAERERIGQLADGGSVSRKLVDETQYQFRAAEAARQEATARLATAKAQLQVAEADEGYARAMLNYSKVRAPFAGVITERNIDTGHFVRAPQGSAKPLFVVARTDKVRVFVDVPEAEAGLAEAGDAAIVRVPALENAEFSEKVRCSSWLLDRVSRTLRVEIDLPCGGRLKPGMYVNAQITLIHRPDVLTVPAASIVREGDQSYCWCVEEGKACRKPIALGVRVDDDVEVVSGLSEEESVVRSSSTALKQGQAVAAGAS